MGETGEPERNAVIGSVADVLSEEEWSKGKAVCYFVARHSRR